MKARAIKDLRDSRYLKVLLKYTHLKAGAIFGKFSNITKCSKFLIALAFITLPILIVHTIHLSPSGK